MVSHKFAVCIVVRFTLLYEISNQLILHHLCHHQDPGRPQAGTVRHAAHPAVRLHLQTRRTAADSDHLRGAVDGRRSRNHRSREGLSHVRQPPEDAEDRATSQNLL